MSPGLKLVLAPLVLLALFTGWVALQSILSAAARSIAAQARLDALQAEARARGWRLERSSLYWAAWVGPAGPIIVKYVGTVDRWRRLSGNHAPLEGEADALEAALKENP